MNLGLARTESSGSVICADEGDFCGGWRNWEKARGKIGNHDFWVFSMENWRRTSPWIGVWLGYDSVMTRERMFKEEEKTRWVVVTGNWNSRLILFYTRIDVNVKLCRLRFVDLFLKQVVVLIVSEWNGLTRLYPIINKYINIKIQIN